MTSAMTSVERLTRKYVVRRPIRFASQPPIRLPTAPPLARMIEVSALAVGSAAPTALSAHWISHPVTPHPPRSGIVPRAIPSSVRDNSGGRKTCTPSPAAVSRGARRDASQLGDSGTTCHTSNPRKIGVAAASIVHRHESGVTFLYMQTTLKSTIPRFAEAPISPESVGRETSDQASEASATPAGHIPPIPIPERNRSTSSCSAVTTKYPSPANSEYQTIESPIALTRTARSPIQPKTSHPNAAPNRKMLLNHACHLGASDFRSSSTTASSRGVATGESGVSIRRCQENTRPGSIVPCRRKSFVAGRPARFI